MRAMWTGAIQFGLVTIPVKMYSATEPQKISFRLLREKDRCPIRYKRVCQTDGAEVDWDEIVKGLELEDGRMIVFSQDELDEIRPERSETINVVRFVAQNTVSPLYHHKHYFLGPQKAGRAAYALLHRALQIEGRIAIGRVVIRDKEYSVTISVHQEGLLMSTLLYPYEIRNVSEVPQLDELPAPDEKQLELARDLIERQTEEDPQLDEFADTFLVQIRERLERKEAGEIVPSERPETTTENDLLAALKASLEA